MSVKEVSSSKCFGGHQKVFSHVSETVGCTMKFSLYVPPNVEVGEKVPVLYFLSGLTCTEENFIIKSGFQRYAAQYKICVVGPDTSPRGLGIQGEDDYYDLGTGAGFYVNATEEKWKKNYRMYSYVTEELPNLIEANFDFIMPNKRSISGHSMGGHGALICALKNPGRYMVATAFAPIANPIASPWGRKVFTSYLGSNQEAWKEYDATHLVASYNGPPLHILVDQGSEDQFLKDQLMPQNLVNACLAAKVPIIYREQDGYDHSYFFVASFLEDHFKHHARVLYS